MELNLSADVNNAEKFFPRCARPCWCWCCLHVFIGVCVCVLDAHTYSCTHIHGQSDGTWKCSRSRSRTGLGGEYGAECGGTFSHTFSDQRLRSLIEGKSVHSI